MAKKIISLFLAVVMMLSCGVVISCAATDETANFSENENAVIENDSELRTVVNAAAAAVIGSEADEEICVNDEFFEAVAEEVGENPTPLKVSELISKYIAVKLDNVSDYATEVAETSKYMISNNGEVYIIVDITQHPEVLNIGVLCESAKLMIEKQAGFVEESGRKDCTVLTYRHIVGELALHNAVYVYTKALGGENEDNPFHYWYNKACVADLNQNEWRGFFMIILFGRFITDVLSKMF